MNIYILTIFLASFFSCGEDVKVPEEDNESISQEELDQLNKPCIDASNTITLPSALSNIDNYSQYEQTILINTILQLSNSLRESLGEGLYPPADAISATVDGITVNANDKGYEWTVGGEKFVYLIRDNGYQIYYYASGSLSGREVVNVDQDENCEKFDYIQYAYKDEGDQEIGDIIFSYDYQKAGTAKIVEFGTAQYEESSETYRMRSFEDLSGEIIIRKGGKVSQNIFWNTDGSGNYQIIEDGQIVSDGTWTF